MITLGRLQLIKMMITQLDVYQIIPIQKNIIDLGKQQKLDADPIQSINFTGNLNSADGVTSFFIIKEEKETILDFSKRNS